jgi:murein DD-endopeptidase MepM/ murein hydrolase activator NlpD
MQALAKAAALAAAVAALSRAAETPRSNESSVLGRGSSEKSGLVSPCPPGTLPDANVCIPVPIGGRGGDELLSERNSHREKSGAWRFYDQIPRRPERPSDYRRYRLPVVPPKNQNLVVSGYDLDRPDEQQRRGASMKAIGHGGIDIAQKRGTEIRLVNLEHQVGDAEVVFVGEVFGNSVVTRHALREGGRLREYVIVFGHLEGPAPGLSKGMNLREGSLVGFVGDSGAPGDVHLHFEVRQVRDGVNAQKLAPGELTKNDKTVVCDPRNVLPLVSQ